MESNPSIAHGAESTVFTSATHASHDFSESGYTQITANTSSAASSGIGRGEDGANPLLQRPKAGIQYEKGQIHAQKQQQQQQQQQLSLEEQQRSEEEEIRHCYESGPTTSEEAEVDNWFATADRYGFLKEELSTTDLKLVQKEGPRSMKWAAMAKHVVVCGEILHTFTKTQKFVKRVYKGIPDSWRRDAWYFLCTDGLKLAQNDNAIRQQYKALLTVPSSHERQIDLDIQRTMCGHIVFHQRYGKGQQELFNVLRAFSVYDKQVGYCQGMSNVVAMLLLYLEEERAFTALVHLFRRDRLHDLYIPGFPALLESFYIQERLMERYLPKLFKHFQAVELASATYATRWYITLFTGDILSYHTLLRIWDVYFMVGYDVFFFVAITLLKIHQDKLLASDMENCLSILIFTITVADDDKFMKAIKKLYENHSSSTTIQNIRKEYRLRNEAW